MFLSKSRTLTLIALLASTPALALTQAQIAPTAKLPDLVARVDIPYDSFTLANGLRVIVHTDRKAPIVAVSVWYHVGSKDEPAGKTGFAHLFEHLMFNGSENSPGDFFEPLQVIGATDMNGTTSFERTNYFETVPTAGLERTLWLESDRMGHLLGAIDQKILDNQRGVVQNEKREGDNQPYGMSRYAMMEGLFPEGHPYHHSTIGSMADLDAASLDDVKAWFRAKYGPNNAVVVLAGDIDAATAKPLMEKYFGDIARGPDVTHPTVSVPTLSAPKTIEMTDQVATTRIMRLWAVPGITDKDIVPLDVAATVLGGLNASRLDNALVRREKLAVSVSAGIQAMEDVGMLIVSADVRPGVDPATVSKRLDELIADLLAKGPNADEVSRVATQEVTDKIGGLEVVGGLGGKASRLAEGAVYANDPAHYKAELAAYAAATPEQVTAVARKWMQRPPLTIVIKPGQRAGYEEAKPAPAKAPPVAAAKPAQMAENKKRIPMPPIGKDADLHFPKVERATLANGMKLLYAHRDTVPVTRVSFAFDAGNAADPKAKLGTQSLMLSLLDEGTTSLNSEEIAIAQERLGASIGAGAAMDRTSMSLTALSANLTPALALYADMLRNPAFAPEEVDRLRNQQLTRIASELTRPQGIATRILPPLLYGPAHGYGVPFSGTGDPAVVKTLTPADLRAFHDAWLRPDKGTAFVVSDLPLDRVVTALNAGLGDWKGQGPAGSKADTAPVPAPKPRILLVDRPGSPQTLILGGQVIAAKGTDEISTLLAANDVLGGDFLSRLNSDLRETKGWAYGVSSIVNRVDERMPFFLYAPVQSDRSGDSIAAILADTRAFLGPKGVTQAERDRTIDGKIRELPGSFETGADVLGGMQRNFYAKRADDYYDHLADRYRAMTAADLDASIRAQIKPDELLWVVVGDAAKVRPQLDQLKLPVEATTLPGGDK
ncbi:M16 family metallopeptidase [Sphingomonas crocodyli]|uniref:Insulinase family protein n=1 Tax=Sphingomonas crocodyli TaxID=1979270 RepID=A0A437M592_9SPHN|nr:pitrilysin family protein [Sphingomonas crocodyli]RVT92746.1 insulinase family protein [Sphingomonas crocodyli]